MGTYLVGGGREFDTVKRKIEDTIARGGVQILLQGGLHPSLSIDFYEELLSFIKADFPSIHIHGFSPPEIVHVAEISHLSIHAGCHRLQPNPHL